MVGDDDKLSEQEAGADIAIEDESAKPIRVVDKRRFARMLGFGGVEDEPNGDSTIGPERQLPSYVEELRQRAEQAAADARSEVEAARGRLERYYAGQVESARADMAVSLLEVFDNLERALEAPGAEENPLYDGVAATRDIFLRKLEEAGISPIESAGRPFDPEHHEAVDEVAVDDPSRDGIVVEELQRGFMLGERLVRPAVVRVGRFHAPDVTIGRDEDGQ